jgi:hypothetical protein
MSRPLTAKLAALIANAASRPSVAATRPPRPAPTASITPQAEPSRTFASPSSSGSTRFGSAADEVGSNRAAPTASRVIATKQIQSVSGDRARIRASATGTRAKSAMTMRIRRSKRSASTPAIGEASAKPPVWRTITSDAAAAEPVSSSTRPSSATVANQSPAKLMS